MTHSTVSRLGMVAAAALVAMFSGCAADATQAEDGTLTVYATTGYLADAVAKIAPDAEITTMVGPGGDPHTYQPSTKDIQAIHEADVVLWNGLHLEAQLIEVLEYQDDRQLAAAETIPEDLLLSWPETDDEGNPLHDPHVWNSPEAWAVVVDEIAEKLAARDPANAEIYRANAADYQHIIAETAGQVEAQLATIPEPRILITGHDAFNYFGATYDLEVYATDFISSEAALSAEQLSDLAHLIAEHKVPVIFQDNQANPQAITSLQEAVERLGWEVEVSNAELYADSLGAEDDVDTYVEVFQHNARAVAEALGDPL